MTTSDSKNFLGCHLEKTSRYTKTWSLGYFFHSLSRLLGFLTPTKNVPEFPSSTPLTGTGSLREVQRESREACGRQSNPFPHSYVWLSTYSPITRPATGPPPGVWLTQQGGRMAGIQQLQELQPPPSLLAHPSGAGGSVFGCFSSSSAYFPGSSCCGCGGSSACPSYCCCLSTWLIHQWQCLCPPPSSHSACLPSWLRRLCLHFPASLS